MRRTIAIFLSTMLTVTAVLMVGSMAAAGKKEGCTPGYWKQTHHFDDWVGYSPSDKFSDVFVGINPFPGATLLQVLKQGGGKEIALGRHAVAALLNTANPNVNWGATPGDLINYVVDNWDTRGFKRTLERANELSCPL